MKLISVGLLLAFSSAIAQTNTPTQRSSYFEMSAATQALQRDDTQNPAMLWAQDGKRLFSLVSPANGKSCASCHTSQPNMSSVALRYPASDAATQQVFTLSQRVNACRVRHQNLPALASEHDDLLALVTHLGLPARGQPMALHLAPEPRKKDATLQAAYQLGERWYNTRIGQLNLSCAQCHSERAGSRLGASPIPQAHPTGYPIYRLEWQSMGSLARRIRGCMTGVRAEPFAAFSTEITAIEVFLAARATGMQLETPGVRP
jgi:L-cysteine S-thiosulfotransferase